MITKYDIELDRILNENAGIITSAEAQAIGASRTVFADFARRRNLERVSRGVYLDPDVFPDEIALLQMRFPKAIISHESALYLYDMTDREPAPFTVTVPSSYNASTLKDQGAQVHYVKPAWYELGIAEVETPTGARVKAYDKERTICDLVRKRSNTEVAVFRQAVRDYAKSKDKDLARLSEYARVMDVETRVHEIMEVVL